MMSRWPLTSPDTSLKGVAHFDGKNANLSPDDLVAAAPPAL
jgi:hypothetical protein